MSSEADWIHLVTRVVEIVGTAIIVVGSFGALVTFLLRLATISSSKRAFAAEISAGVIRLMNWAYSCA